MVFGLFKKAKVVVSSVNVKWRGSTHSLGGMSVNTESFEVTIPFQHKPQEDFNLDFLKTQKKAPVTITRIDVREPFKLISSEPALPQSIDENAKVVFKVKITPPDYNYEGPLNMELLSDNNDMVHVEITKIIIITSKKRTEVDNKPMIMDLAKGQVFKQNTHLFGIVDFDGEVKNIKVSPPFTFVSSDPKVPFKIDRKTGYLIDVYIQAPKENYGGPLEVELS